LRAIADVQRFTKAQDDGDDIDAFFDDEFIDEGSFDVADVADDLSISGKRKLQATLAGATVGKQQNRPSGKRQHKPTNRFGINAAQKDTQVLFATENRTLKQNLQLLMVPGKHSQQVPQHVPVLPSADLTLQKDVLSVPLFPTDVSLSSAVAQPLADLNPPTVVVSSTTPVVDEIRQQNTVAAAIASSMSTASFASLTGNNGGGDSKEDDNGNISSSDYGTDNADGQDSVPPSDGSEYNDVNDDATTEIFCGYHSDLFENLFQRSLWSVVVCGP
jgi:hypothetical protein